MFAGINVCIFETKPCLQGYVCRYLFLRFKDGREFRQINPSQTLMNLQYIARNTTSHNLAEEFTTATMCYSVHQQVLSMCTMSRL